MCPHTRSEYCDQDRNPYHQQKTIPFRLEYSFFTNTERKDFVNKISEYASIPEQMFFCWKLELPRPYRIFSFLLVIYGLLFVHYTVQC
jgi:hypothetical protein